MVLPYYRNTLVWYYCCVIYCFHMVLIFYNTTFDSFTTSLWYSILVVVLLVYGITFIWFPSSYRSCRTYGVLFWLENCVRILKVCSYLFAYFHAYSIIYRSLLAVLGSYQWWCSKNPEAKVLFPALENENLARGIYSPTSFQLSFAIQTALFHPPYRPCPDLENSVDG